jgi:hypothetical protein
MTPEEIQERNKQIALMLGLELPLSIKEYSALICKNNGNYHSDWNWLMNTCKFIEDKGYGLEIVSSKLGTLKRNYPIIWCEISKENHTDLLMGDSDTRICRAENLNNNKIEAVFIAVSAFAKLYNEGKI